MSAVAGGMAETGQRAVFLDLNGTFVLPLKPDRLDELVLIPGAAEADQIEWVEAGADLPE